MKLKSLLFLPLDIPNPPNIVKELDKISYDDMTADEYRNCYHIPIMRYNKKNNESKWVYNFPKLKSYLEQYVFPWSQKSRVVIVTTKPKQKNPPHIDCSPDEFNLLQHKFRFVFQGNTNDLKFLTNKVVVNIPKINKPFIMDGSWPHEMTNTTNERKYTLALGTPWQPKESDKDYMSLLERSYIKYKKNYISNKNLNLPKNYEELYEDIYKN